MTEIGVTREPTKNRKEWSERIRSGDAQMRDKPKEKEEYCLHCQRDVQDTNTT